jgi:hypothetical protein
VFISSLQTLARATFEGYSDSEHKFRNSKKRKKNEGGEKTNKRFAIAITAILIFTITSSAIFTPTTMAQKPLTPQERIRLSVENGFNRYVQVRNLHFESTNAKAMYFAQFLNENPQYRTYLKQYLNLTKPDINKVFLLHQERQVLSVDQPFEVFNITLNGQPMQVSYSKETFTDGSTATLVKVGCNGTDPEFAVERVTQTVLIDGDPIEVGEHDYLGLHYNGSAEIGSFLDNFNDYVSNEMYVTDIMGFLWGACIVVAGLTADGPACALFLVFMIQQIVEHDNLDWLKNHMNDYASETHGLWFCFESDYSNEWFRGLLPTDFKIWIRHFDEYYQTDEWVIGYPHIYTPWPTNVYGQNVAWKIGQVVDDCIGPFGNATWNPCYSTQWPLPEIPPADTGLLDTTMHCRDGEGAAVASNVYLDNIPLGNNNPTVSITPEHHNIKADMYIPTLGSYGYTFDYMTIEGTNYYTNQATVQLSTNSTVEVHYTYGELPMYLLTVNAFDLYLGESWPYEVGVYLDGDYIGTTPLQTYVMVGDHSLSVDPTVVYSELWGLYDVPFCVWSGDDIGYNQCGNTMMIGMYSASTVNAMYWPWG